VSSQKSPKKRKRSTDKVKDEKIGEENEKRRKGLAFLKKEVRDPSNERLKKKQPGKVWG